MYYGLKKWWVEFRLSLWRWAVLSAQGRESVWSKRLKRAKAEEESRVEWVVQRMQKRALASEAFKKAFVDKYPAWKLSYLKKLKQEIGQCEKCHRKHDLTLDHIIPAAMLKRMGIDPELERDTRNLRLLCRVCNLSKGAWLDFTDLRTKPLLLEYLRRVEGPEEFVAPVYKKPEAYPKALFAPPQPEKPRALTRWEEREERRMELVREYGEQLGNDAFIAEEAAMNSIPKPI